MHSGLSMACGVWQMRSSIIAGLTSYDEDFDDLSD